jgi:chromosome segregation ATPase
MTNLANRDKAIQTMMTELENKRQLLTSKYKTLHNSAADNSLLKDVLEDYLTYYTTIKKEKKEQYDTLNKTLEHIESIAADPSSDERILYNTKMDYKEISDEMNKISKEIEILDKNIM